MIIYGCGYVKSKDYWRLGGILGVVYIAALLLIGWPIAACGTELKPRGHRPVAAVILSREPCHTLVTLTPPSYLGKR